MSTNGELQTVPIVPTGADGGETCIKASNRWHLNKKLHLKKKMRVNLKGVVCARQFFDLLLKTGNGKYPKSVEKMKIPSVLTAVVSTVDELITQIH